MAGPGLNNDYKMESNVWLYTGLTMDTRWEAMMAVQGLNNGYKVESDVWLDQGLTMDTRWRAMYGWTRA